MRKILTPVLFLLFASAGCDDSPSDQVNAVADESADFCSYHTFKYYSVDEADGSQEGIPVPPTVATAETLFKNETTKQLKAAGVTQSDTDPDLRVNYLWAINEASVIMTDCGSYWYGSWFGYACIDYAEDVPIGTVMVDLVDSESNQVVFRGVMQGIVNGEDTDVRIANAMDKVFESYPPNITPCP